MRPERVERARDLREVAVADVGEVADRGEVLEHVVGVAAAEHGVVPEPVGDAVDPPGGVAVGVGGPGGARPGTGSSVMRDLGVAAAVAAEGVDGQPVGEQQVVGGGDRGRRARCGPGACTPAA